MGSARVTRKRHDRIGGVTMGSSAAPSWYTDALASSPERRSVRVRDVQIAVRTWGAAGNPDVVLIHGAAAHGGWWDHIGPRLAAGRRVTALDLSGHGDSDHRADGYDLATWADEVMAAVGPGSRPVVIGHSLGGIVALQVAHTYGTRIAGVVTVDSPVVEAVPADAARHRDRIFGRQRSYPSLADAVARFRPVPDQDALPYVVEHIAAESARLTDSGWQWKFDPRIFVRPALPARPLAGLDLPAAAVIAAHGIVPRRDPAHVAQALGAPVDVVEIPAAGHHVMLDRPLELVSVLEQRLSPR
jgi:pimeloyl-ACP methyl ester carboxylesterase